MKSLLGISVFVLFSILGCCVFADDKADADLKLYFMNIQENNVNNSKPLAEAKQTLAYEKLEELEYALCYLHYNLTQMGIYAENDVNEMVEEISDAYYNTGLFGLQTILSNAENAMSYAYSAHGEALYDKSVGDSNYACPDYASAAISYDSANTNFIHADSGFDSAWSEFISVTVIVDTQLEIIDDWLGL